MMMIRKEEKEDQKMTIPEGLTSAIIAEKHIYLIQHYTPILKLSITRQEEPLEEDEGDQRKIQET